MKILFDFLPILFFFVAYKIGDIYWATLSAIFASFLQVFAYRVLQGSYDRMHLITLGIVVVFGSATLLLRDEWFIKLKPTVLYWMMAIFFYFSEQFGTKKPLMHRLLNKQVELPEDAWKRLNSLWVLFFALMGLANLGVIAYFDTNTWVNFKVFGTLGLTLIFVILQGIYMAFHLQQNGHNQS